MLSLHGRIAALALLPLLLWGAYRAASIRTATVVPDVIDIGIEHKEPVRVRITRSLGATPSLIDIENAGTSETIFVTVPERWTRGEVRGAPLSLVISDDPEFGYTRWHIPAGAEISFVSDQDLLQATVHNPSTIPLNIDLVSITFPSKKTDRSSTLVTDQSLSIELP